MSEAAEKQTLPCQPPVSPAAPSQGHAAASARFSDDPASPHPDAELILWSGEHIANRRAVESDACDLEDGADPHWAAYCRTRDAISRAQPRTLAGLAAKARAAKAEAHMPDGSEEHEGHVSGRWAWDLVADLLRLHAGEVA